MNVVCLDSWTKLPDSIRELKEKFPYMAHKLLFRGQADSAWKLDTTMERKLNVPISVMDYYKFALTAKPKLETFGTLINVPWNIPTEEEFSSWLTENTEFVKISLTMPLGYEYLAYLRHHGFPSPLLDWTFSPYIALFFAFNYCKPKSNEYVSVYCFLDSSTHMKVHMGGFPRIHKLGVSATVHQRHNVQQSQYTICVEFIQNNREIGQQIQYSHHESVFNLDNKVQDILWKFNLPSIGRNQVLKFLQRKNINSFSLFGSEDSLVESIATNEIINGRF